MKKAIYLVFLLSLITLLFACKDNKKVDEDLNFHLIAVKDEKYGIIDQDGNEVLPFEYKSLSNVSLDGVMVHAYFNNLYELLNLEGESIVSSFTELIPLYDKSMEYYTHPTPYAFYGTKSGVASLYDSKGQHFMDIDSPVYVHDQRIFSLKGYFNLNDVSKELIDNYETIYQFSDEAYFALKESTVYVLNSNGEVEYDYPNSTMSVMQNFIKISNVSLLTLFDYDGKKITKNPNLKNAYQIQDTDYILIYEREKFGVIDLEGNIIVPSDYIDIDYNKNMFRAKKDLGFQRYNFDFYHEGVILNTLDLYASGRYYGYGHGSYVAYNDTLEGYYYYQDDQIIGGPYNTVEPFNEKGFAAIRTTAGLNGIINEEFEIVDSTYRTYTPFYNVFIVQSKSGENNYKWGILDENLDLAVPVKYELLFSYLYPFTNLIALLDEETAITHYYVIDDEGELKYLYDLSFEDAISYVNELVNFSYEDDYVGNLMKMKTQDLPEGYEIIDIVAKDYIIATLDGKYGVLNSQFEVVIPFDYDIIIGNDGLFQ
ncbi:MAG: hypothetical protein EP317_04135 [Bacillota bacterium]|nr:MAG: hypothetical protein EP317_04135 [Bacillota bacterium]